MKNFDTEVFLREMDLFFLMDSFILIYCRGQVSLKITSDERLPGLGNIHHHN